MLGKRIGPLHVTLLALPLLVLLGAAGRGRVSDAGNFYRRSYEPKTVGHDVSWPNCQVEPPKMSSWGVAGVTGGLVFHPNPCLKEQFGWFRRPSLYANTGYAGIDRARHYANFPKKCGWHDERCLAYNYGFNAGKYAVELAAKQSVHSGVWWLDVEFGNSWSDDVRLNRASIQGMHDAILRYVVFAQVGYYSYPGQWDRITGSWRNGAPAWVATGEKDILSAVNACKRTGFTGRPPVLSQFTPILDENYSCPHL